MEEITLKEIAQRALEQMPPDARFREEDASVIGRHKELLLSWEDELVRRFYDTLFAHPPTKAVFREGERREREETLRRWWRRTVAEPIDEEYFGWMALVGLAHVVRGVENPMMLAMVGFVEDFVEEKASHAAKSGMTDALRLIEAFTRLGMVVAVIIAYSYETHVRMALSNVVGMEPGLLRRLSQLEAERLLLEARQRQQQDQEGGQST